MKLPWFTEPALTQGDKMGIEKHGLCLPLMATEEWSFQSEDCMEAAREWAEGLMSKFPSIAHVVLGWSAGGTLRAANLTNPECYTDDGFKSFTRFFEWASQGEAVCYVVHGKHCK